MKKEHIKWEFHGMQIAMQDLKIDALYVVYPGERWFNLAPGIEAVPLWAVLPPA